MIYMQNALLINGSKEMNNFLLVKVQDIKSVEFKGKIMEESDFTGTKNNFMQTISRINLGKNKSMVKFSIKSKDPYMTHRIKTNI